MSGFMASFAGVIFMAVICLTGSIPVTNKRAVADNGCISKPVLADLKDGLSASNAFTVSIY